MFRDYLKRFEARDMRRALIDLFECLDTSEDKRDPYMDEDLSAFPIYHFGIMISNIHMAWMRAVCGRLKSDYSYSNTIVYNNFP